MNPAVKVTFPKILVACEFSGIVRDAFREKGYNAWSCDILPSERPGPHIQADVTQVLDLHWDLMIAHPPCKHLAVSGARWFEVKGEELRQEALRFFRELMDAPIPRIAIENPVSIASTHIRKPDQIIQPWQFGEPEQKKTCLWLKNLPKLKPTMILKPPFKQSVWRTSPSPERWKLRSRTFPGIANAMASQWGEIS